MPQILIIAVVIFTLFRDSIFALFKTKEAKVIGLGVGAYLLYNRFKNSENKEELSNNLPNSAAGSQAQRLYNAFHPYFDVKIPLIGHIADGTDEDAVKAIAVEMGRTKNYSEVSAAYNTLFSSNLKDDLNSEGVYDLFFNAYNAQTQVSVSTPSTTTPATTSPAASSPVANSATTFKKGDTVYSYGGWNLRDTDPPYGKTDKTVAGEDWILYNNPYRNTIDGITATWVVIQQPKSRYIFYPSYYVCSVDALYKK